MIIFVYFKVRVPDDPKTEASGFGDLCYIYPIENSEDILHHQANLTLDTHRGVIMDLNIPCGDTFKDLKQKCQHCETDSRHPDDCDYIKFTRPTMTTGNLFEAPEIKTKRRFKMPAGKLRAFFGDQIETDLDKMTDDYKKDQYSKADTKSSLQDKG